MKYFNFREVQFLQTTAVCKEQFWNAINLWNLRPNLLNKRLVGCEILCKFKLNDFSIIDEVVDGLQQRLLNQLNFVDTVSVRDFILKEFKEHVVLDISDSTDSLIVCYIKKFLPKSLKAFKQHHELEISILDYVNGQATFFNNFASKHLTSSNENLSYCYRISYKSEQEISGVYGQQGETIKSSYIVLSEESCDGSANKMCVVNNNVGWLTGKLLPKLAKWAEKEITNDIGNDVCKMGGGSLKLIEINQYYVLYQKLKEVYGKTFVKIWPESTDPLKFVYEDVAIAAYLLLLWRGKPQTFVDMGCGNGLLVHILTSEGHHGLGVDVRPRKIWDLYPKGTANLQVKTITPTLDDSCLYQEADWLIGNHSDELTPWIPVLASMSSYSCNFFLLPCCSYELNGKKYQRQDSSKSQYMDYMDHIVKLCDFCGFNVSLDKLRIPSTKRICIVSNGRKYLLDGHTSKVCAVRNLIKAECCINKTSDNVTNADVLVPINDFGNFKTRSEEIAVRNCTQLNKDFVNDLVILISKRLLRSSTSVDESNHNDNQVSKDSFCWNEGTPIALNELAKQIPGEYLKRLKKECGGLQTLIRNHHYIFKIDKGFVRFRKPVNMNSMTNRKNVSVKTKHCWFFSNHPDKCPLGSDECTYIHS